MDRKMAQDLDRYITGNYGEDQFKNEGHAESTWECSRHTDETSVIVQEGVTFDDIALAGIPICHVCGEDMELVSEVWIDE